MTAATATLQDTVVEPDDGPRVFFVATSINDREFDNSINASKRASTGQGFRLGVLALDRQIAVLPSKVAVVASHVAAAPIQEIVGKARGTFLTVEGIVSFDPVANETYRVNGELAKDKSCIWIEDVKTKAVVSTRHCTQ